MHIDVKTFLERESQAGDEVIEMGGANSNLRVFFQNSVKSLFFLLAGCKAFLTLKNPRKNPMGMYFRRLHRERIFRSQVPCIACEFTLNVGKKPGWPEDFQGFVTVQHQSQKGIEANEMVNVGVGDKGVGNLKEFSWANISEFSHVKEQSPAFPEDFYKEHRVSEGSIENLSV
jgi:hypothetical protein